MSKTQTNEQLLDELQAIVEELSYRLSNYRDAKNESRVADDSGLVLTCRAHALLDWALGEARHTRRVLERTGTGLPT